MTQWHGYIGFEDINLSAGQRSTFIAALKDLGLLNNGSDTSKRNQSRPSLDGSKLIVEAAFDDSNLLPAAFKQRLADIFGVAVGTISHVNNPVTFDTLSSPVVTFSHGGQDKLRVALFGNVSSTWNQSRLEEHAYRAANSAEWEDNNA